ncbi:lysophospholipid acyltransferase family protein [Panacagrimonas perspica]|uniref:lysophospholipid acyltransferase family protein n=1 Tax=Panacagrimonas perspica TaxID=381431 RepID=UPI0014478A2A|nr:lysophospholipid acyltransferase family protein [Panacagrimonas perspica]
MNTFPTRPRLAPSLVRWIACGLNALLHFVALAGARPFSRSLAWRVYQSWGRTAYRIFGIEVSVQDDNGGRTEAPRLYVWLNQSNLAEAFAFPLLLPRHATVINLEYAAMPLLGWARTLIGDLVIVRQWKSQAKRGIGRAARRLADGEDCMISIEGVRSADGPLRPFKKGPVLLAIQSGATIVPMYLYGGREVLPRGEWRIRPGRLQLRLLEALTTQGLSHDDRNAILDRLRRLAEEARSSAIA